MDLDEELVRKIHGASPAWKITVGNKEFVPSSVKIEKCRVPVKNPGMRGGVYFSETSTYSIKCHVNDPAISPLLTSTMLGPNTDFVPIRITATLRDSGTVAMSANLTNYVQSGEGTRLNMIVVDADAP